MHLSAKSEKNRVQTTLVLFLFFQKNGSNAG